MESDTFAVLFTWEIHYASKVQAPECYRKLTWNEATGCNNMLNRYSSRRIPGLNDLVKPWVIWIVGQLWCAVTLNADGNKSGTKALSTVWTNQINRYRVAANRHILKRVSKTKKPLLTKVMTNWKHAWWKRYLHATAMRLSAVSLNQDILNSPWNTSQLKQPKAAQSIVCKEPLTLVVTKPEESQHHMENAKRAQGRGTFPILVTL